MSTSTSGLDLTQIEPTIAASDDLFRHFNGKWLATHEIPPDRSSDGAFGELRIEAERHVHDIIESASGSEEATKIRDLYSSFMAADVIESKGYTPIIKDLAACDSIQSLTDFISTMSHLEAQGLGGIFGSYIYADPMDASAHIFYLGQGGLSLPDESYYREEQYADIREAFLAHMEAMFSLVGIDNGKTIATSIMALESAIARCHWDAVKDRDRTLTYNRMSRAEISALMPAFDWDLYLSAGEIPGVVLESVIVREPSFFSDLSTLLAAFDRDSWVNWLKWNIISGSAPYLSSDLVDQNFSFYGKTLSGTPELRERWKRAVSIVEGSLGEAIGKVYVERHFPPAAKARMADLVSNLLEAYRISISELEWMSDETKAKALEKLAKFNTKIGYPDKWWDYSKLSTSPDDLFTNIALVTKFQRDHEISKIGKPVDRDEWMITPQTVNAFYNPIMNEIVFPAAILQPPFFSLVADDAVNYGGIGAVIGHEIGHGFDDQGSKYDGDGALNNWWSDADRAAFELRSNALIDQYNQLRPEETPDIRVNGALTVGENIGDLGGLSIAYKAYQISLAGTIAPVIDGLTGDQRFFYSWASFARGKVRPEELRRRIATDPHSPYEFRCNQVVKNIPQFYSAFGVSETDGMWLDEKSRVQIW